MKRLLVGCCIFAMACLTTIFSTVYAGEMTSTGFYYPFKYDTPDYSGCGKWLNRPSPNGCYPSSGVYHIGVDMAAGQNDPIYAIADGKILSVSTGGWSSGSTINIGIFIEHYLPNGQSFTALYGHIETSGAKKSGTVKAGEVIGKIGDWNGNGDHLHFAIVAPGLEYPVDGRKLGRWPDSDYGKLDSKGYYDNGLIDPIWFITHNTPDNMLSRSGTSVPDNITIDNPWFGELCVKTYDSRCDGSSVTTWEECVLEGSTLCAEDASKWSALVSGGYSSGNTENAGGDVGFNPLIGPLPNLHIEELNVHDTPDHKLPDDGTGYLNPSQTYELHVWPKSLEEHCGNGTDNWEQEVRTDTFVKISLSKDDGEWELVHRSYTHCKYMDEDDSKKEIFDWTCPADAAGKLIAFKSKVDTQNIIQETDEKDNWSDTEYYPVEGYCPNCPDMAVPYIGLTAGKTSVDLGGKFGLEVDVMNQGNANCPIDIRGAYYLKAPNSTNWTQVADDGSEASDLDVGESEREYTMDSPFTANQVGAWQAMFCADYLNAVREQNENNNCQIFNFNVNPVGPDLIISSLGFKEGLSFKRKISSHPWANVRNIGNKTPSSDIRIAYYIDGQYRDDDGVSANELTPGRDQCESVNNNNIRLGDWGTRTLTVCVDTKGQVPELNEGNNCASVRFTVIR